MVKRYYPIVKNFDEVKGLELEGPLGTVSVCNYSSGEDRLRIEQYTKDEIQKKCQEDDRFSTEDILLKIKDTRWEAHYEGILPYVDGYWFTIECDVYKIKRKENGNL